MSYGIILNKVEKELWIEDTASLHEVAIAIQSFLPDEDHDYKILIKHDENREGQKTVIYLGE